MSIGPLMLDLEGKQLSAEERELLLHPSVGGVILFSRNYESPEQLRELTSAIHNLRSPRLLLSVDHEGGRVQRFRDGFTSLPAMARLGEVADRDLRHAKQLARDTGWMMAVELRALGVDFSFAPVLDVDRGVSTVIGDRAFHRDPERVAELAHAYMQGMHDAGMAATGKHFPGHGSVAADSHTEMPVDERDLEDILNDDGIAFERLIHYGIAALMPAHVLYPKVDAYPPGFSAKWLRDVLRGRLGFKGAVFSDDLSMVGAKVVAQSCTERAKQALRAGCDMVLVCNDRNAAVRVAQALQGHSDPVAHARLARMHGRSAASWQQLHRDSKWRQVSAALSRYSDDGSLEFDFS